MLAVLLFASASCERFDPEDRMTSSLDMERCMKPVSVKTEVENATVTLSLKVFHDAEYYLLETYSSVIYEDSEPYVGDRVDSITIKPSEIPYTFTTIEDATLYYRISAVNDAKGRERSYWTVGKFKTTVDPAVTCLTLDPDVREFFEMIKFNWNPEESEEYDLEVYTKSIPSTSEPDVADLYMAVHLTNDDLPYSSKFPLKDGSYYFRVRAIDTLGIRKDSKWAKGSFKVNELFSWPNDPSAFDYGVKKDSTKIASLAADSLAKYNLANTNKLTANIQVDNVTWLKGPDSGATYYSAGWIMYNKRKKWEYHDGKTSGFVSPTWSSDDGTQKISADTGFRLSINRPGQLRFFPKRYKSSDSWEGKHHEIRVVLTIPLSGGVLASTVYNKVPADMAPSNSATYWDNDDYWVIVDITEDMLFGMIGPATLYVWHETVSGQSSISLHYVAPRWTPSL